jgi:hypothetical protein
MTFDTKPSITKIELGEIKVGINQQPTRRQSADFSDSGDIALLTQLCQNHATYVLCLLYSLYLCTAVTETRFSGLFSFMKSGQKNV